MARFIVATALLLAAAVANVMATSYPTVTTSISAETLAKGIVKKLKSSGSSPTYVTGSATLLGATGSNSNPNKLNQTGYFTGASATLIDSTGNGVILTSGPATNLQTGSQTLFSPTRQVSGATDSYLTQVTMDGSTYDSSSWENSVSLQFNVVLAVGNFSGSFAFCTNRLASSYTNSPDLAIVTLNSTAAGYAENNILLYTGVTQYTTEISVITRFGLDSESSDPASTYGQPGTVYGLSSNITRCLAGQTFWTEITTAGTYTMTYTVANEGNVQTAGKSQQAYLLAAAIVVTDYPDNYNPNVTNSLFTGTDEVNNNDVDHRIVFFTRIQTWCVIGSSSGYDLVPGYRVEGVTAGASNKYCCRVWGHFNSVNNTCDVKSCAQVVTSFTSYVKSTDSYKDCYADCYQRTAYIGNDPYTNFGSVLSTLYDNRTDNVVEYTTSAVTSGVTLNDGLVYAGTNPQRTFAYRHGELVFSETSATTGIVITAASTTYICQKRGVMSSATTCVIGCDEVTTAFFSVGTDAGDRCFSDCYYISSS